MLAEERRNAIVRLLREQQSLSVRDLSRRFEVADETIRRDFNRLEDMGLLRRTHGGAVAAQHSRAVPPMTERQTVNLGKKQTVASLAAEIVEDGQTIFLDGGTTTLELARLLHDKQDLTVVTNGLLIAAELAKNPHAHVNMVGGAVRKSELALVGPEAVAAVKRLRVHTAFLACAGLTLEQEIAVSNPFEAEVKRSVIDVAQRRVLLADSTKWGKVALVSYAKFEDIDLFITDDDVRPDMAQAVRDGGGTVLTPRGPLGAGTERRRAQ